jgi:hypothetical protein
MQLWSMRNVLNNTPFLRDANESFVKLIVDKLVRKVFSPREIVIQQGKEAVQVAPNSELDL